MSEQVELKACPFCGGVAAYDNFYGQHKHAGCNAGYVECPAYSLNLIPEAWNNRPIEDALQAKLEIAEGALVIIANGEHLDPLWVANEALEDMDNIDAPQ